MIFNLYQRVLVRLDDGGEVEEHVYDRTRLMYTEVAEVERLTGQMFPEWDLALRRGSITAFGALLHILRKRDGMASDYVTLQFNAAQPAFDLIPLHEDDTEFTQPEIEADLNKRMEAAREAANPTPAADVPAAPGNGRPATHISSLSSPSGSGSGRGNGRSSRGTSSAGSRAISTPSARRGSSGPRSSAPGDAAAEVGDQVGDDGGDVTAGAVGIVG